MRIALIACLAVLTLATAACKKDPSEIPARIDAALAPLVPADTKAAGCIRLDLLKKTPWFDKYVAARKIEMLEQFRQRTGLDPLRDIYELTPVTDGKSTLVFVRGKFGGQFGLEPSIEVPGLQRTNYKGHYLLEKEEQGVAFFNTGAAVAGRTADLRRIIDNKDNAAEKPPQRLLDLVASLPGSAHIWAVTTSGASILPKVPGDELGSNLLKVAASLGEGWMWVDLSNGIDMEAEGAYPDDAAARQIHDALRGFLGMARLRTPNEQPDLLRVYDQVSIKMKGRTVIIGFHAPFDLADRTINSVREMLPKKGPA